MCSDAHLFVTQPSAVNEGDKADTPAEGTSHGNSFRKYVNGKGVNLSSGFHKLFIKGDFSTVMSSLQKMVCKRQYSAVLQDKIPG